MRFSLAIALLLAGCGQGGETVRGGASENQIKQLSTPEKEVVDPQATARIAPLRPEDLAALGPSSCEFSRGGRILLAVTPADSIARIAGQLRHFTHSSPMGPTGGFFEDRHVSISVGRTGTPAPGEGTVGSWPGRII
ncbi:MAG TPA: hypothetical protein VEW04_03975, partial [Allosphingosinicella sp.]|nr:hypothetical protein [Allosphingosinicella sp.]